MALTDEETRGLIHVALAETTGLQRELGREIEQSERELTALQRDAAISLLLDYPVERTSCEEYGRVLCWSCRVDKFLRDAGLR